MSTVTKLGPATLCVTVKHRDSDSRKCKVVTTVGIRLSDGIVVAGGTLGGMYSARQALAEFRKQVKAGKLTGFKVGTGYTIAKEANLI